MTKIGRLEWTYKNCNLLLYDRHTIYAIPNPFVHNNYLWCYTLLGHAFKTNNIGCYQVLQSLIFFYSTLQHASKNNKYSMLNALSQLNNVMISNRFLLVFEEVIRKHFP